MLRSSVPGKTSKVLVCGYQSCGKTSILEQLIYGSYPCDTRGKGINIEIGKVSIKQRCPLSRSADYGGFPYPTIEDIYCTYINTDRGVKEKLRFFDTAGTVPGQTPEFFKTHLPYAEGVVFVYAINSRESFSLLDQVKKEYDKYKEKKELPIIVLGNKIDLQYERQVDYCLAHAWSQKEKVKLFEVTAADRRTLIEPFVYLASKMNPPPSKSTFAQLGKKGKAASIPIEL